MKHRIRMRMGDISSTQGDGYVKIEMEDAISGVHFLDIEMSYEQFGKMVKGAGSIKVDADLRGLDYLGKKRVMEARSIVCRAKFDHLPYSKQQEAKEAWLAEAGKEDGWIVQPYLGSQNSITGRRTGGPETFHYSVFKYVDITDEERQALLARPW